MAKSTENLMILAKQALSNEDAAVALMTKFRWPNGVTCPKCGGADPYKLTPKAQPGRPARKGLYKCSQCKRQFSVTTGTVFEASHISLSRWLMAIHLMASSKKGKSAHQLHRMLGVTYRAAWFMNHRIRLAMASNLSLFVKLSGTVEADETYIGGKRRVGGRNRSGKAMIGRPQPNDQSKTPVLALVERKGRAVAFLVERVDGKTLQEAIRSRVDSSAQMMTDELHAYDGLSMGFKSHDTIKHSAGVYANGAIHTNTVEGFFALLKRGVMGSFHHISKGHLHRYCDEFSFRYTASVFHLMRIAEHGLVSLALAVGETPKNTSWGGILQATHKALKANKDAHGDDWKETDEFYAGASALMHNVKNAWRNTSGHIRGRFDEDLGGCFSTRSRR